MNIIEVDGKKYQQVEQPAESWEENPCWDCVFGKEDGECHAPQEILDFDETLKTNCGFYWGTHNYIYKEL